MQYGIRGPNWRDIYLKKNKIPNNFNLHPTSYLILLFFNYDLSNSDTISANNLIILNRIGKERIL
jgi:hypothetical protein